ncbi:MAG TPA: protein kinase [Syntrophorhabdales bacterium]|nr:protein kinase [Syntrophorhabdales bacterium]
MSDFQPARFGKYILVERLATGGMAQLYRAKILGVQGFEKLIAIKMILPHLAKEHELVSSFIDEAKLAALLNHQNIVQIYDFGSMEDSYFISMEYLFGKDLRAIATKSKGKNLPVSLEHALYIMSRVCAGLDYAHKLKDFQGKPLDIIHRDISPQNIFVTYEGDVKILDFGIAKAASQSTITQYGMIKGKVAYMSPEQAAGKFIDRCSDIFSTGILLYELVTGIRMFTGDSTMQILAKVREAEFDPPESVTPGLPAKVFTILNRALAKEPEQRYQSGGEMLRDLEECMVEISLRPTAGGLAQYMKDLFQDEITAEDLMIREVSGITKAEEPEHKPKPKPGPEPAEPDVKPPEVGEVKSVVTGPEAPEKRGAKKLWPLYAGIAAIVLIIGLVLGLRQGEAPIAAPQKDVAVAPAPPSAVTSPGGAPSDKVLPVEPAKKSEQELDSAAKAKVLQSEASALMDTDPQKAKSLLLESVKLDPKGMQGYFHLGLVYVKLKEYPKAIETYQKVVEIDPNFPDIYFNLGYAYAMNKEYEKAEEMYGRVVTLSPTYLDEALFNLAMVQERQGKKKEGMANLEKAVAINPQNTLAKEYLDKLKATSRKSK